VRSLCGKSPKEVVHIILSILSDLCSIAGFVLALAAAITDKKTK
jgi:hypothetical protein